MFSLAFSSSSSLLLAFSSFYCFNEKETFPPDELQALTRMVYEYLIRETAVTSSPSISLFASNSLFASQNEHEYFDCVQVLWMGRKLAKTQTVLAFLQKKINEPNSLIKFYQSLCLFVLTPSISRFQESFVS
jgi:hypothetical protein